MNIIDLGLKFVASKLALGNTPRYIGLHHSAGINTVKAYHQEHLDKGWAGLGYNFVVDLDGKVYKGRDPKYLPAGIEGHNTDSLHICAIGNFDNMVMPAVQKEAIKELILYCMGLFPTIKAVKGHKELMATDCPGANYPLRDMQSVYTHGLIQVTPQPTPSPINSKIFKLQHALNAIHMTDDLGRRLVEDGMLGDNTKQAIKKAVLTIGSENALVGWIQEQLKIKVDNVFGKDTHDAIGQYQRDMKLRLDFLPGYWTILRMAT